MLLCSIQLVRTSPDLCKPHLCGYSPQTHNKRNGQSDTDNSVKAEGVVAFSCGTAMNTPGR